VEPGAVSIVFSPSWNGLTKVRPFPVQEALFKDGKLHGKSVVRSGAHLVWWLEPGVYVELFLRTVFMTRYAVVVFRFTSGRRARVSEFSLYDFIIIMIVGAAVVAPMLINTTPMRPAMMVILSTGFIDRGFTYFIRTNRRLRDAMEGRRYVLIRNGEIQWDQMAHARMRLDELMMALRQEGYTSLQEIRRATLERNGSLSIHEQVRPMPAPREAQPAPAEQPAPERSSPTPDAADVPLTPVTVQPAMPLA